MKASILVLLGVAVLSAATLDSAKFARATGVKLDAPGATVEIAEGRSITGKVVDRAFLLAQGVKGVKEGDAVKINAVDHGKATLVHVLSNQAVTVTMPGGIVGPKANPK
jgi:hypothetical protein